MKCSEQRCIALSSASRTIVESDDGGRTWEVTHVFAPDGTTSQGLAANEEGVFVRTSPTHGIEVSEVKGVWDAVSSTIDGGAPFYFTFREPPHNTETRDDDSERVLAFAFNEAREQHSMWWSYDGVEYRSNAAFDGTIGPIEEMVYGEGVFVAVSGGRMLWSSSQVLSSWEEMRLGQCSERTDVFESIAFGFNDSAPLFFGTAYWCVLASCY